MADGRSVLCLLVGWHYTTEADSGLSWSSAARSWSAHYEGMSRFGHQLHPHYPRNRSSRH